MPAWNNYAQLLGIKRLRQFRSYRLAICAGTDVKRITHFAIILVNCIAFQSVHFIDIVTYCRHGVDVFYSIILQTYVMISTRSASARSSSSSSSNGCPTLNGLRYDIAESALLHLVRWMCAAALRGEAPSFLQSYDVIAYYHYLEVLFLFDQITCLHDEERYWLVRPHSHHHHTRLASRSAFKHCTVVGNSRIIELTT